MATKTDRPRVLIEQWLPIAEIGAECMRERGASSALPPLYFLHVWWARRPLTVSRAAILASLLPAYPTGDDDGIRPWPAKFCKRFPSFDEYKGWFLRLIGIIGDPVAARRLIDYEKRTGRSTPGNKYGYPRAFTYSPSAEHLETLYDFFQWTWGTREVTFCDPMAGGGSIPFEALRYGLTVHANELNPVASVVLKATLDYPFRFGARLLEPLRRFGKLWAERTRRRLSDFFPEHPPTPDGSLKGGVHLWARTVACPVTGRLVPLSPHWWIRKGDAPLAVRVVTRPKEDRCTFEIVHGKHACASLKPDHGTIKRGTAISPWTGEAIEASYIKAEAQAGRMGHQMYAIEVCDGGSDFRAPTPHDEEVFRAARSYYERRLHDWEVDELVPVEPRKEGRADWSCQIYGMRRWCETFTPRQLVSLITFVEELRALDSEVAKSLKEKSIAEAVSVLLAIAVDKAASFNSMQTRWDGERGPRNAFERHDFSMKWSFAEFDASRNLGDWVLSQLLDAYGQIVRLVSPDAGSAFPTRKSDDNPVVISNRPAQAIEVLADRSIRCICVDPPYYDNVMYAECSNFFYVWMKRTLGHVLPEFFTSELANAEDEAVMNVARFKDVGRKAKELATADYENKMMACFKEMHRVLTDDGVLTVMFTHKQVEAWDTLGTALIRAGFCIDGSWPVHTESEASLHQARKNAAASTILLACRKRHKTGEPVWWDDLKKSVRETARRKATEFEAQGIRGVDLYISTFGPVLSIISENWPVLTAETDLKTGDPLPLKPGEALDLARQEVVNLRKQGLLLGRAVEFDPVTDWYLMAWDAFRAQEFPADEARKLALALGLDLEKDLVRDKRLVTKKSASVVLTLPADRRKKGMVDEDAETFPHLIDALHTAMMIYDEEGSKACQVFVDRQGLRTDSRIKALVQAMMEAIPTTRDKEGKFLRPEMTTLDALRMLFWDDLPAPKEEEPPKIDPQKVFGGFEGEESEDEEGEDEESEDDE